MSASTSRYDFTAPANATASKILDLPLPFSPIKILTRPSSMVSWAMDLKFFIVTVRNMADEPIKIKLLNNFHINFYSKFPNIRDWAAKVRIYSRPCVFFVFFFAQSPFFTNKRLRGFLHAQFADLSFPYFPRYIFALQRKISPFLGAFRQMSVHLQNFSAQMKLWQKGFDVSQEIERFTVGRDREMDLLLAQHDVLGSIAHISMLQTINLLSADELRILKQELQNIYAAVQQGNFCIEAGVEDVHSQVELLLTRKLGDAGKKIHSGRSRNDQVLLDLKLFVRSEIKTLTEEILPFFELLLDLSEQYKNALLPGYTHYQVAMPSSFGLWFGAYAESLTDDMLLVQAAYRIANRNPLGSAAGYGSSFPLNRQMTTDLLGFEDMNYNVVYAQMGRGKTERIAAEAIASVAATLGKMAQDICLYISQNFAFVSFPPELTTGSSIMPHKKNPDVFELVRAKANKMMALPNEIALITANLASGYHRDLQLIKENFLPVFEEIKSCLRIMHYALQHIEINQNAAKDEKYKYMFSVETVNELVINGMSFRDAYRKIGEDIANGTYQPVPIVHHTHEGSIGNLCNDRIRTRMEKIRASFDFEKTDHALAALLSAD